MHFRDFLSKDLEDILFSSRKSFDFSELAKAFGVRTEELSDQEKQFFALSDKDLSELYNAKSTSEFNSMIQNAIYNAFDNSKAFVDMLKKDYLLSEDDPKRLEQRIKNSRIVKELKEIIEHITYKANVLYSEQNATRLIYELVSEARKEMGGKAIGDKPVLEAKKLDKKELNMFGVVPNNYNGEMGEREALNAIAHFMGKDIEGHPDAESNFVTTAKNPKSDHLSEREKLEYIFHFLSGIKAQKKKEEKWLSGDLTKKAQELYKRFEKPTQSEGLPDRIYTEYFGMGSKPTADMTVKQAQNRIAYFLGKEIVEKDGKQFAKKLTKKDYEDHMNAIEGLDKITKLNYILGFLVDFKNAKEKAGKYGKQEKAFVTDNPARKANSYLKELDIQRDSDHYKDPFVLRDDLTELGTFAKNLDRIVYTEEFREEGKKINEYLEKPKPDEQKVSEYKNEIKKVFNKIDLPLDLKMRLVSVDPKTLTPDGITREDLRESENNISKINKSLSQIAKNIRRKKKLEEQGIFEENLDLEEDEDEEAEEKKEEKTFFKKDLEREKELKKKKYWWSPWKEEKKEDEEESEHTKKVPSLKELQNKYRRLSEDLDKEKEKLEIYEKVFDADGVPRLQELVEEYTDYLKKFEGDIKSVSKIKEVPNFADLQDSVRKISSDFNRMAGRLLTDMLRGYRIWNLPATEPVDTHPKPTEEQRIEQKKRDWQHALLEKTKEEKKKRYGPEEEEEETVSKEQYQKIVKEKNSEVNPLLRYLDQSNAIPEMLSIIEVVKNQQSMPWLTRDEIRSKYEQIQEGLKNLISEIKKFDISEISKKFHSQLVTKADLVKFLTPKENKKKEEKKDKEKVKTSSLWTVVSFLSKIAARMRQPEAPKWFLYGKKYRPAGKGATQEQYKSFFDKPDDVGKFLDALTAKGFRFLNRGKEIPEADSEQFIDGAIDKIVAQVLLKGHKNIQEAALSKVGQDRILEDGKDKAHLAILKTNEQLKDIDRNMVAVQNKYLPKLDSYARFFNNPREAIIEAAKNQNMEDISKDILRYELNTPEVEKQVKELEEAIQNKDINKIKQFVDLSKEEIDAVMTADFGKNEEAKKVINSITNRFKKSIVMEKAKDYDIEEVAKELMVEEVKDPSVDRQVEQLQRAIINKDIDKVKEFVELEKRDSSDPAAVIDDADDIRRAKFEPYGEKQTDPLAKKVLEDLTKRFKEEVKEELPSPKEVKEKAKEEIKKKQRDLSPVFDKSYVKKTLSKYLDKYVDTGKKAPEDWSIPFDKKAPTEGKKIEGLSADDLRIMNKMINYQGDELRKRFERFTKLRREEYSVEEMIKSYHETVKNLQRYKKDINDSEQLLIKSFEDLKKEVKDVNDIISYMSENKDEFSRGQLISLTKIKDSIYSYRDLLKRARQMIDVNESKIAKWEQQLDTIRTRLDEEKGPAEIPMSPRYEKLRSQMVKKDPEGFLNDLKKIVMLIRQSIIPKDQDRYTNDLRTATIDYLRQHIKDILGNQPMTDDNISEMTSPFIYALNLSSSEANIFHKRLMDALKSPQAKTADEDDAQKSPTDIIEDNYETPEQKDEFYDPSLPEYKKTEKKLKVPEPKVKEWDVVQHLFGKDIARAKELREQIEKGSMVTGDAYRELVKEFLRKQKEIPQKKKFLDIKVEIGDEKVPVKEAGERFRDLLDEYQEKYNKLVINQNQLREKAVKARNNLKSVNHYVDPETGEFKGFSEEDKQNIANLYLKQLFWNLQKYWMTQVGRHNLFGGREYAPYAQVFNTFKNLVGVRSNPRDMEKINQSKFQIPELMNINKELSKYREKEGKDFMEKVEEIYRNRLQEKKRINKKFVEIKTDDKLSDEEKSDKIKSLKKDYLEDDTLYFDKKFKKEFGARYTDLRKLLDRRNTIQKQKYNMDPIFEEMLTVVDEAFLTEALEGIRKKMEGDDEEERAFIKQQRDKVDAAVKELARKSEYITTERKTETEKVPEGKKEEEVKQASYRNDKNFNMNVFYSPRFQKKLAELMRDQ